jgi:hypothetical protein
MALPDHCVQEQLKFLVAQSLGMHGEGGHVGEASPFLELLISLRPFK